MACAHITVLFHNFQQKLDVRFFDDAYSGFDFLLRKMSGVMGESLSRGEGFKSQKSRKFAFSRGKKDERGRGRERGSRRGKGPHREGKKF